MGETDVIFANGLFVQVGNDGSISTSGDGTNWVSRTSGTNGWLMGVTYGNDKFVAVGSINNHSEPINILTSPDGTNWSVLTSVNFPESASVFMLREVTYGHGLFVAVGNSGEILTSSDGTTWVSRSSGTSEALYGVTCKNC
jgi:hypothetical protein